MSQRHRYLDTPDLLHALSKEPRMTDAQKRQYVSNLYSGPKWKKRVEKMRDDQVAAIYFDHQSDGTRPHHDEDTVVYEESPVLEEIKPDLGFLNPHMGELSPRDPHANEDDFPTY